MKWARVVEIYTDQPAASLPLRLRAWSRARKCPVGSVSKFHPHGPGLAKKSVRVRSGPRGSGRARVVEFSLNQAGGERSGGKAHFTGCASGAAENASYATAVVHYGTRDLGNVRLSQQHTAGRVCWQSICWTCKSCNL